MEKKIRAWRDKNFFFLTLVLSEKKFLNETKNHEVNQVKWSVPYILLYITFGYVSLFDNAVPV